MNEIYRQGRCLDSPNTNLFFSERPSELAAAQSICVECDVRIRCLEFAIENCVEWGVWGGVIFWDGEAFHRKRGRGRPKRSEVNLPFEVSAEDLHQLVQSA